MASFLRLGAARRDRIRDFVLENVAAHGTDIIRLTERRFSLSRAEATRAVRGLCEDGMLQVAEDQGGWRYALTIIEHAVTVQLVEGLAEHDVWDAEIKGHLSSSLAKNVVEICAYGFTEMMNNAIDHSEAQSVHIFVKRTGLKIELTIWDQGVGIFNKIQQQCQLENPKHAVLELAKGKLTTDPERHTGEGIFFTSRMFDKFTIMSGDLFFSHLFDRDWLLESGKDPTAGTWVKLEIDPRTRRTPEEVFSRHASGEDLDFSKTVVPVKLSAFEGDSLVSRSQAKRLVSRFDKFQEVMLDFDGVKSIGPAFADEIFRVFQNAHPEVHLLTVNAPPDVLKMIERAKSARAEQAAEGD